MNGIARISFRKKMKDDFLMDFLSLNIERKVAAKFST